MPEALPGSDSNPSSVVMLRDRSARRISPEQLAAVARLQDYWRSRTPVSAPTAGAADSAAAADHKPR
jgi:hypothetical protein